MVIGRFAPTPSGALHLGNLFCSLLAWLSAKSQGGRVVLRIEDLDAARCDPVYTAQAERDLRLLGLDWDEGGTAGGPEYFQSARSAWYQAALETLEAQGLVYPCFCSRAQTRAASAPHASDSEPIYAGTCRGLTAAQIAQREQERAPALRLRVPRREVRFTDGHYGPMTQRLDRDCGDFILRRSDGVFAYQLAVVADDAAMGVTQVVRGRDLLASTPRQLLLYQLLGWRAPAFFHTPLLLAPDGRRLSKRDRDDSLSGLLDRGFTPQEVVGRLAFLAGLLDRPAPAAPADLLPLFDWGKVPQEDILLPEGLFDRG